MINFVKRVIRDVIGDPRTPDECLDALKRLAKVDLPTGLTVVDRQWIALWYEELLTRAQGSARLHEPFSDELPAMG